MTKEKDQEYPPLVSDRSPSFERARREHRHPTPATDPDLIAVLNRLVEAEHHAADIFAAAVDTARDPGLADDVAALGAVHQVRGRTLADLVSALGAAAPRPEECTRILSRDPGDLAYVQDDAELLAALAATEDELLARYDAAVAHPSLPADAAQGLARLVTEGHGLRARLAAHTRGETRF